MCSLSAVASAAAFTCAADMALHRPMWPACLAQVGVRVHGSSSSVSSGAAAAAGGGAQCRGAFRPACMPRFRVLATSAGSCTVADGGMCVHDHNVAACTSSSTFGGSRISSPSVNSVDVRCSKVRARESPSGTAASIDLPLIHSTT